jgi:hypothetical protein
MSSLVIESPSEFFSGRLARNEPTVELPGLDIEESPDLATS